MVERKGYFEATVDFDDMSFRLPYTLIGKVLPFKFKNQQYQVHFPNFEATPTSSSHFKVTRKDTKIALNWLENDPKYAGKYGGGLRSNNVRVMEFSVRRLIVRSRKEVTSSVARKAKQDLLSWRDLLPAWLEVLDYRDLVYKSLHVEQERSIDAYFVSSDKKTAVRRVRKRKENGATIRLNHINPIDPRIFRKALRKAEAGKFPPNYYLMLISGLKHCNASAYRQSLFDTATAIEMAMTKLLDRRLTVINPRQKKNLMKESQQLSGLAKALRITGEVVPADIQTKIGTPRNKAIHEGREVGELQAREALTTAKDFITKKLPL